VGILTISSDTLLKVLDLRKRGVLAAGTEEVTEAVNSNTAVTALVEQGESLLVVGRSLIFLVVRSHD
jgi:hypothetical protein